MREKDRVRYNIEFSSKVCSHKFIILMIKVLFAQVEIFDSVLQWR